MATHFEMLGPGQVVLPDGTFHRLKPTMRDQALAYLAITGEWVTRDRLGFLFWADSSDSVARHNVRQLLKRIRQLGWVEGLESDGSAVRWLVESDVAVFRNRPHDSDREGLPKSGHLLVGLERNASLEFEEWLLDQRHQIRAEWQTAVVAAAQSSTTSGKPDHGLKLLEPLLAEDNGGEVLPIYMNLATKAGQRGLALAAFRRVETRLRNDLGMDMPKKAQEIAQRLTRDNPHSPMDLVGARLVGRESELTEISGLLTTPNCRLLTLVGPGGIGKSLLARAVFTRAKGRYIDGGTVVSLEAVRYPADMPASIASQLELSLDARIDPIDQLIAVLREAHMLLILDNIEHLRDAWPQLSRLLRSCPTLEIVVTSRERLRLEDEWVYEIPGLSDADGVKLLLGIAQRIAPDAAVTPSEAQEINRSVGGSPLGLELAIPWLRVMTAGQIVSELQNDHEILSGGHRDGLERHESMTANMRHSWDLATTEERHVIEALSVFAEPYTRESAAEISEATPALLRDLMDKSLLRLHPQDRYSSHPLVRTYAANRLFEDGERRQEARRRHAEFILGSLAESVDSSGLEIPVGFETFGEDALTAWRYAVGSLESDLLSQALEGFVSQMIGEGRIDRGLKYLTDASPLLNRTFLETATTKLAESRLLYLMGRHAEAAVAAVESLSAAVEVRDQSLQVRARLTLGWAQKWITSDSVQYETISKALPIAEALRDSSLIARTLNGLGCSAPTLGECISHLKDGLNRAETRSLRAGISQNLGIVSWAHGGDDTGIGHVQLAIDIARSDGDRNREVDGLATLAFIHGQLGDLVAALQFSIEAETLVDNSTLLEDKIYLSLISGEIYRFVGDRDAAQARASSALTMAAAAGIEPFTLRALRLHGQLLIDRKEIEQGLGILAFVMKKTTRKGGDFTSEVTNPRVWDEAVSNAQPDQIRKAHSWAKDRHLNEVTAAALSPLSE